MPTMRAYPPRPGMDGFSQDNRGMKSAFVLSTNVPKGRSQSRINGARVTKIDNPSGTHDRKAPKSDRFTSQASSMKSKSKY